AGHGIPPEGSPADERGRDEEGGGQPPSRELVEPSGDRTEVRIVEGDHRPGTGAPGVGLEAFGDRGDGVRTAERLELPGGVTLREVQAAVAPRGLAVRD